MMTKCSKLFLLLALSTGVGLTQCAKAYDASFSFAGLVTNVTYYSPLSPRLYAAGDILTGSLWYDSWLSDFDPDPGVGYYSQDLYSPPPHVALFGNLAGVNFSAAYGVPAISVVNGAASDSFSAYGEIPLDGGLSIHLENSTGTALNSDALPAGLNLSDWDSGYFQIRVPASMDRYGVVISGVVVVPEPSALVLSALALAILTFARRREASTGP
jgi:hypothetical protein